MMSSLWVVLFVSLTGSHLGFGLPVRLTPQTYPHDASLEGWTESAYVAIPALALVIVAVAFLLGCTWCYRHKDCKPNEGADNQLFTASASHIQTPQRAQPPDSGFSEPANNNVAGEDNNNGPISLREMQNIANNNAAAYIFNENEERNANRYVNSRESIILFDPLPMEIHPDDPLEPYSEWFTSEHFPRNNLQYLREVGRGWFGRVVASEIEAEDGNQTVAVKILNQNSSLEEKARFLEETRIYRQLRHELILQFLGKCLEEEPWLLLFELCTQDLQRYLIVNRPRMAILNENGVPLQLMSDVSSALAYMHSNGFTYGYLWGGSVLVRGNSEEARAVLGRYEIVEPQHDCFAPEVLRRGAVYTPSSEIWSLGTLIWEVCSWGSIPTGGAPSPPPELPCPYKSHLYQVMQLCWNLSPEARPSAGQVHALVEHLRATHEAARAAPAADLYAGEDFERRWQTLKPNSIPKVDEHIAIIHAPSTSTAHFTESDTHIDNTLSVDMDTAVSRSSSIMSDKDPLDSQLKSESLTNLHGSLEDVGNIYLTHNETAAIECNQGNIMDDREKENDRSDSSVDPWLKEIIAGSQDDVSYYKDVSDVIKNLDNILNSEKTSSSESSHQASPSRDNLSLDCKKDYPVQSSMVKSPGISNFQNLLDTGFPKDDEADDEEVDRVTIGTLSHSFERHSDTTSQHTLENITPDTPMRDFDVSIEVEHLTAKSDLEETIEQTEELPKDIVVKKVPKLKELCVVSKSSLSETVKEQLIVKDCETSCDSIRTDNEETKSLVDVVNTESVPLDEKEVSESVEEQISHDEMQLLPHMLKPIGILLSDEKSNVDETQTSEDIRTETDELETETDDLKTETDEMRSKSEERTKVDESETKTDELQTHTNDETSADEVNTENEEVLSKSEVNEEKRDEANLPVNREANIEEIDTLPSVTEETSNATEASQFKLDSFDEPETTESENNYSKDETILVSDLDIVSDSSKDLQNKSESNLEIVQGPEVVQTVNHNETPITTKNEMKGFSLKEPTLNKVDSDCVNQELTHETTVTNTEDSVVLLESSVPTDKSENDETHGVQLIESNESRMPTDLPPAVVQNTNNIESLVDSEIVNEKVDCKNDIAMSRSDNDMNELTNGSTEYMDLICNSQIQNSTIDSNDNKNIETTQYVEVREGTFRNESTIYMDLPSLEIIKKTDDFIHMERVNSHDNICASTPLASDNSADILDADDTKNETLVIPCARDAAETTPKDQRRPSDCLSPYDSPTKSHPTDTFDENSSVVLGSFDNCSIELSKAMKNNLEMVEMPREELLAFSANFSEMNLETPSPLRDGNFLNEVPDILPDDNGFDDLASISEPKEEPPSDSGSGPSGTEKHVSPSTPPNSPGVFPSTSAPTYIVDIDLSEPPANNLDEIDLNQIELQITSKLAIAENENNLNIEYSGPLTVEGLIEEGGMMRENDEIPEAFLAGNGDAFDDLRDNLSLDEACVQALRNELELKLPLAQVASIEPQVDSDAEWSVELPPPPELVVSYPGALSPIQEETGPQLSAYENDMQWNPSIRTDSSESYPEPCNNSTDDVTELPTGNHEHTYTMPSRENSHSHNNTYTVCKEAAASSRDLTMSADSLNASPLILKEPVLSPIDDRTYNKDDKDTNCERISQVSPFLVSPTTDTSAPELSDNTRVSTSKTTLPTDAKHSKPESQCLSKATSIDSWCSNDTLYNVEENFDDLAMEPDCAFDNDIENEGNSESTDTLTHHDDAQELSHCSTYIIHDSKSENCETFSPDSITANDNYTYTKVKTDVLTTPSATDVNDSTKPSKDLAYGTLMSGIPSYSCTSVSGLEDVWKLPQPELIRRSPNPEEVLSPLQPIQEQQSNDFTNPNITEHSLKKLDSVDISCLQDNMTETENSPCHDEIVNEIPDSLNDSQYRNMAPSITSTPLIEIGAGDNVEVIPMQLPEITDTSLPSFRNFQQSVEVRPQDLSTNTESTNDTKETEILLEGESKTLSGNSLLADRTPNYLDFENSAVTKPQDLNSREGSSQNMESVSSGFSQFENFARNCPQDLSSLIDASSLLLKSERLSGELAMSSISHNQSNSYYTSQSFENQTQSSKNDDQIPSSNNSQSLPIPPVSNLIESQDGVEPSLLINFGPDDETEQPHSIIVTEVPTNAAKISPNRTYDSHPENVNFSYDSHQNSNFDKPTVELKTNGEVTNEHNSLIFIEQNSDVDNVDQNPVTIVPESNETDLPKSEIESPKAQSISEHSESKSPKNDSTPKQVNGSIIRTKIADVPKMNGNGVNIATVNFLSENFEELVESNVDDAEEPKSPANVASPIVDLASPAKTPQFEEDKTPEIKTNGEMESHREATEDFLQNEKKYCQPDTYLPLLSDIRFTGPAAEIMSTSFSQDSPTEPASPECEQNSKPSAAEILKEWDSDSDSQSSNSSSGEFIWKQRGSGGPPAESEGGAPDAAGSGHASDASGDSCSGSEGDEVEFVPSSWDCRAAPSKSSLRSLDHASLDAVGEKKRVVFKRQKYHCVYEYPREALDAEPNSPAYLPDLSTYSEWDPSSVEEAELCYGHLFSMPNYPLRAGIAIGSDYDEDFFISSSARPFESLGIMSTTSQFFPGMHVKPMVERDLPELEDFPPPPSPLPTTTTATTLVQSRTPSLDFTTPDSGVEDITPGSTTDEDFKKKLPESELTWRPVDSASSSESVSPSSPGGEALGGLRHTRDKLKLDLPPSPHVPSPRHNRVFNFVLEKPKRREAPDAPTPLVMTDETPIVTTNLPLLKEDDLPLPEPTFSTFGKSTQKTEPEQKIILDEVEQTEVKDDSAKVVEPVKGEGTVLDSGDEDSGIESSKATLERKANVS